MASVDIQCGCGAIAIRLSGEPVAQFYCHCDDCQTVHAAAYIPIVMVRRADLQVVAGAPRLWCRERTPRATCPTCGTRLYAEPPGMGVYGVSAQLLPPGTFRPTFHIFCEHARLPVVDDLPHYRGVPALFGGAGETVAW
jgi:hypothetical protein